MLAKDAIDKLINRNRDIVNFIKQNSNINADEAIVNYSNNFSILNCDSSISVQFAHLLQFSSDSTLYGEYELKDIELLFDSFLELHQYSSDVYIDAANFADAVMNDKHKAKQIIEIGIKNLQTQLSELQEIKKELDE